MRSPRPRARPDATAVPDEVAIAIAASVDNALGEALAEPPPEGTFEAQALALAEGAPETPVVAAPVVAAPEAVIAEVAASVPPPEGTLEAQALALAAVSPTAPLPAAEDSLEAQVAMLSDVAPVGAVEVDTTLAIARPMARPEAAAAENQAVAVVEAAEVPVDAPVDAPVAVAIAEVVERPATPTPDLTEPLVDTLVADASPAVTEVVTVAAAVMAPMPDAPPVAEMPPRNAPIFDSVEPDVEIALAETPEEALVVVAKSTSGGRHWGVNVGDYTSRSQAERELLKVALVESTTLNQGLRKISEKSGSYHANFMGLTEDQAGLACRRLRARGVACETLGP